jgi:hypothetical protein
MTIEGFGWRGGWGGGGCGGGGGLWWVGLESGCEMGSCLEGVGGVGVLVGGARVVDTRVERFLWVCFGGGHGGPGGVTIC